MLKVRYELPRELPHGPLALLRHLDDCDNGTGKVSVSSVVQHDKSTAVE
jgi:hypothetical protein